jgi:hypothetical protein
MQKIIESFYGFVDNYLTGVLLKKIKPVDITNSEYIFIFNQVRGQYVEKLYPLVSYELYKRGIASFFLYKNDLFSPHYPRFKINGMELSNSITKAKRRCVKSANQKRLFFKWSVDLQNEKIEAEGINFFPIIRSSLRTIQKRYNVIYYGEDNKPLYDGLIQSCDLLLKYFLLLKEYSKNYKKKIRLVGWEISYVPNGVFKMLCDQLSHNRDVEFVELGMGYISYFGQHHFRESYIASGNLTKTKKAFCWAVSKEELAGADDKNIAQEELIKPATNALKKDLEDKTSKNKKETIKLIENYRSRGKKIFALFAHLFYDTPVDDESPAFNGMCEWIKETVNYFIAKDDLLLIKPHPSEFRSDEPRKTPNETVSSFLTDTELSENIIILDPRLFSVNDLSPFISCGLIWRSSVAMELAFLGIPGIIAGVPYYNALNLNFAVDKGHYFQMIEQSNDLKVTDELKIDVAKYLYLHEKKHFHIDSIIYNKKLRQFYWNRKALARYLKNGDSAYESVVENMLE